MLNVIQNNDDKNAINQDDNNFDNEINSIIKEVGLEKCDFFNYHIIGSVNVNEAYCIAYNWREITKSFLFSSIKGLSKLVDKIQFNQSPDLLAVLQTCFNILSDDLGNGNIIFKKHTKLGIEGIHYKWWEDTILRPLSLNKSTEDYILPNTAALITKMYELCDNYLGVAVQLRIVESIALNICKTFLALFSNVTLNEAPLFKVENLVWITSHITVEKVHHEQVCNEMSGMARVAITVQDKAIMLNLIRTYSEAWLITLNSFTSCLKK